MDRGNGRRANPVIPLREDLLLVRGAKNSALYDLSEGKVYPLEGVGAPGEADGRQAGGEAISQSSSALFGRKGSPAGLRFIWLELTSRCNLRCLHCYGSGGPHAEGGEFVTSDWKRVIQEAASVGCQALQFTGGEPLLHPDLLELIGYARGQGYRCHPPGSPRSPLSPSTRSIWRSPCTPIDRRSTTGLPG